MSRLLAQSGVVPSRGTDRMAPFWLMAALLVVACWVPRADAGDLETQAEYLMIQNIMKNAGVLEIIYQVPDWIEQEMKNLEATPVPFDHSELTSVRSELESAFSLAALKERLKLRLAEQFTFDELTALNEIFKQPGVKEFHSLQEGTRNEYIKADIRSYKAKLKNMTPRGSRVEMVKSLDENLKQSRLETELKVELRKSLLTSVSWVKSNELLKEGVLEKELSGYRERVGEEINRNALIFYLYLFKRTPSPELNELVSAFQQPDYKRFMAICHEEMLASIKEARRQIPEDINLAGN
ncbi:MAG: hypothetical protein R3208_17515 [Ketobacteraceae bacterium]|nr:hypothetical protein [Ketobacteraceae bacterium]